MRIWKEDLAPILKDAGVTDVTNDIKAEVVKVLRETIAKFAKERLDNPDEFINKINIIIDGSHINIIFFDDIVLYMETGTKAHKMWALLGKTVPIKDKYTGETIFRKVTAESLLRGWEHPGTEGKHVVSDALLKVGKKLGEALKGGEL